MFSSRYASGVILRTLLKDPFSSNVLLDAVISSTNPCTLNLTASQLSLFKEDGQTDTVVHSTDILTSHLAYENVR